MKQNGDFLTKFICVYAFYVPMALAGSPQFALSLFVKSYETTGNTLRLWHYVRRDGGGSVHNRLNIYFGIPRRVNVSKSSVSQRHDEQGFGARASGPGLIGQRRFPLFS